MQASPKLPLQITGVCITGTWIGIFIVTILKFKTIDADVLYRLVSICLLAVIVIAPISWFLGKVLLQVRLKKTAQVNDLILNSSLIGDMPSEEDKERDTS